MTKAHKTKSFSDLDYWLAEWLKSGNRASAHTHIAYRADVKAFLDQIGKPFNQVAITDLLDYQSSLPGARSTRARKMAAIRSFYRFLNNREAINPPLNLGRLESPKIQKAISGDKLLTEKEVKALIDAASADKATHVFVRFLYLTAARISEALGLRWRDLSEALMERLGDRELGKGGGEAWIRGKGDKHRLVFIPAELWQDLQSLRGSAGEADVLFPALNPHSAWRTLKKLAKAAKIDKNVSPHSLRHAHLSHALANGATLAECRDQGGHSNISTTSLYLHASGERATASRLKVK